MKAQVTAHTPNSTVGWYLLVDGWLNVPAVKKLVDEEGLSAVCLAIRRAAGNGTLVWGEAVLRTPQFFFTKVVE